jgi:DNA-binding GntR family transcriptional regulator
MRRVSHSSLREHFEVRAMLETEAARLAALHHSGADIVFLRQLLVECQEPHFHATREAFIDAFAIRDVGAA